MHVVIQLILQCPRLRRLKSRMRPSKACWLSSNVCRVLCSPEASPIVAALVLVPLFLLVPGTPLGEKLELFYKPDEKSWNAIRRDGEIIKLSSMEEGFYVVHLPDQKEIQLSPEMSREEGLALLREHRACYTMEGMLAEAR